jgi:5-methylcytosine-specific restriction endonuclease McrA
MTAPERRGGRPWRRLRAQILAGNPACAICRVRPATTVDHIVPVSRGGRELDPQNCRPACAPCNYAGGARITNAGRGKRRNAKLPISYPRVEMYPPEAWLVRPGAPCHFPMHENGCGGHLNIGWW